MGSNATHTNVVIGVRDPKAVYLDWSDSTGSALARLEDSTSLVFHTPEDMIAFADHMRYLANVYDVHNDMRLKAEETGEDTPDATPDV